MGGRDRSMIHELWGGGDLRAVEAWDEAPEGPLINAKAQRVAKTAKGSRRLLGVRFVRCADFTHPTGVGYNG